MPETSAALLMYRRRRGRFEVLLVHPGGPFWAKKDDGAWSIPKGLCGAGEDPEAAARREFAEETGYTAPGALLPLGNFQQSSAKQVQTFAVEGDFDPARLQSNTFELEWPPRSGRRQAFPEVDRAQWFDPEAARRKLIKGQVQILGALLAELNFDN